MPVCDEYKVLYFHIPKTAGTSVESMLGMHYERGKIKENLINYDNKPGSPAYQHFIPEDVKGLVSEKVWKEYHKCVTVRNPYDRAVSSYEYLKKNGRIEKELNDIKDYLRKAVEVAEKYENGERGLYDDVPYLHHYRPQKHWFMNGNDVYDTVVRYENLQEDIGILKERIGCERGLPHEQKTRKDKSGYMKYFDKNALLLLEKAFGSDFELSEERGLVYAREH